VVPKDEKNVSTYHGTPRDTGGVRIPALSVFGGHGPEGIWPFVKVVRPAPQGASPDCFRLTNLSRRLPFVNNNSKDHTFLREKKKYVLTNGYGSAILIGGREGN
jgi:hypothetical protein